MSAFSRKVVKFRLDAGLSLRGCAAKFKTSQTTVQRIERGGMPTIPVFLDICKAMKYAPEQALKDIFKGK